MQRQSHDPRFNFIRYANVWEDADILCQALSPRAAGGRLLSISSSGDNVLALLTLHPKEVVAIDLSFPQLACLELRMAAFKHLSHTQVLEFLGILPSTERITIYSDVLQTALSPQSRAYFSSNQKAISEGIIHCGRFEKYLRFFGRWILPLIHCKEIRSQLVASKTKEERYSFYEKHWNTWRWKLLFKVFFSRYVMGRFGRDPSFFNEVKISAADNIFKRTAHALTECATDDNPYLRYIVTGNFTTKCLPRYLRKEHFETIKGSINRINIVHGAIDQKNLGTFDGFNLSDIFEYMTASQFKQTYHSLIELANPKARLVYWNMLVDRRCPEATGRVQQLTKIADDFHMQDKAWFYQSFRVEEVLYTQ